MKISKIIINQLKIPLKKPYKLSKEYGTLFDSSIIVLEVHTDEGFIGYGECDPWPLFTGDTSDTCTLLLRNIICPYLIGKDPTNIREIHRLMDALILNNHIAKSAVDMAMYDITGKATNMPVHKLLGGKLRSEIDVMWSLGGETPEESVADILRIKEMGYRGCMIKVGGEDYKLDAARTIAAREAAGPDFMLNADANQGWDVDTAIRYGKLVKNCDLMFFEQPVKYWDVDGLAKVRRAVSMPISADEGIVSMADARRLIQAEAVDIFSIKVTKNGGILPASELCEFSKANGIRLFFNSMIEEGITQAASLAVGATASALVPMGHAYFSVQRMAEDITNFNRLIRPNGTVEVPESPGLGIELNYTAIQKYKVAQYIVI
ncbi:MULTISPECIES: mandelate racemase/muconate lactonizing enzyme family protein [unclassified Sedimentibacter]|uniref:mandelate racemase/muconate lactonizing enzyme family protein n=1 Tax=unclassified Sedimentibacter TaxID=2649220 RepID=UPI0027E06E63|nr:enolase C-terminal domain-like protein [Sedimentibacter sp. MB35-C1]WMJ76902.1 enolase C-terminal domain-like protein [Sedimentibacter sp. MB35-C1]